MTRNEEIDKILKAAGRVPEASPTEELNPAAVEEARLELDKIQKYEDKGIEAGLLGAARGLTFGLSDQLLAKTAKLTGYTSQELNDIKKYNELESTIGEAAGIIAPSLLTGGAGAAGAAARGLTAGVRGAEAIGKATQTALAKVLADKATGSAAKSILAKTVPKLLGSATEGAIYGTGQLISENALGNADINAENILASAGTGALLGGAARGLFEAPKLLSPIAKKVGTPVSKKFSDFFDREGAALEYIGATSKKAQKLKNLRPEFVKEAPDWLASKANMGIFTKTSSIRNSIEEIKDIAATQLDDVSKLIDNVMVKNSEKAPLASQTYFDIAKYIMQVEDSKLIKGIGLSKLRQVKKSALDLAESKAKTSDVVSALELRKFKREIDEIIPYGTETTKSEVAELKKLRTLVDQKVKETAQLADEINGTSLLKKYEEANKDYSYASIILPNLDDKLAKEAAKSFPGFNDAVLTGVTTTALGAPVAAAGLAIKKFAESDAFKRAIILGGVERASRSIDKKINSSIVKYFKKGISAAPKLPAALMESSYSLSKENKKPKDRLEAFQNANARINELISDPDTLERTIARRTLHMQPVAPNITTMATQTATRALQFLHDKLPKQASAGDSASKFAKRKYIPSELEMSRFERYLQAVEDPMSAIDQLESGTLTREAAEAIRVVYPNIFVKMQKKVLEELENSKEPVSYNQRLQLGILLDVETDNSLKNSTIAGLQQNLVVQAPQGPTPARADNVNIADRVETKMNRIAQR